MVIFPSPQLIRVKLMRKFFRCKSCLFPSTKPDLHFDDDGTCGAYISTHCEIL